MAEEAIKHNPTDSNTHITPREALLQRAATIFGWGAVANGILAGLVLLLGIVAALRLSPGLFASLHNLLLASWRIPDDIALIAVLLLVLANVGGLLLLMIGTLAQELWALVLVWVWSIVNVVVLLAFGFTPAILTLVITIWAGILISRDHHAFRSNPVMLKELRGRMRGMRAFVVITVYLGLMSIVTVLVYLIYTPLNQGRFTSVTGELGRIVFLAVVGIELLLIIFIAPAFTAGAITGERERKTYDLLQTTLLPNSSFITGKLQSALGYILLLLLAAVPLQSIAFLFGGVSELELGVAFVVLSVSAVALGAVGLYFSSTVDRTLTATVRAYTVALIITFGIPLVMSILLNFYGNALTGVGTGIKNSPVLETVLIYIGLILTSLNPIATGLYSQYMLIEYRELGYVVITLNSDGSQIPLVSPWISFTIIYLVLAVILILLTVRRMRNIDL